MSFPTQTILLVPWCARARSWVTGAPGRKAGLMSNSKSQCRKLNPNPDDQPSGIGRVEQFCGEERFRGKYD